VQTAVKIFHLIEKLQTSLIAIGAKSRPNPQPCRAHGG
jgi:hypothetical protein